MFALLMLLLLSPLPVWAAWFTCPFVHTAEPGGAVSRELSLVAFLPQLTPLVTSNTSWPPTRNKARTGSDTTEREGRLAAAGRTAPNIARVFLETALLTPAQQALITTAQPAGAGCAVLARRENLLPARVPNNVGGTATYDNNDGARRVINEREFSAVFALKRWFARSILEKLIPNAWALLTTAFPDGAIVDTFADLSNVTSEWNTNNSPWTAAGTLTCTTGPCTGVWRDAGHASGGRPHPAITDVAVTLTAFSVGGNNRICIRAQAIGAATNDGYCYVGRVANDDIGTESVTDNIFTLVGTRATCGLNAGDSFGGRNVGTNFTPYCAVGAGAYTAGNTVTDTTYTGTGFVGLYTSGDGIQWDNLRFTSPRGGRGR